MQTTAANPQEQAGAPEKEIALWSVIVYNLAAVFSLCLAVALTAALAIRFGEQILDWLFYSATFWQAFASIFAAIAAAGFVAFLLAQLIIKSCRHSDKRDSQKRKRRPKG